MRVLVCVCAGALYILGVTGCETDEPKNVRKMTFPISFCLPADEVYGAMGAPMREGENPETVRSAPEFRAFGDPGTTEQFALPQYLYIFIVKYEGSGEGDKADLTKWKVWQMKVRSFDDEAGANDAEKKEAWEAKWVKKHYTGAYANVGDSIFQYTEEIILLLNGGSFDGQVYAVASAVPLTLPALTEEESTLADVLGMQFSFTGTAEDFENSNSVVNNLQNIYSTPYNYNGNGVAYYGSFFAAQNVPHLDLLLYHVAAKVDLMWNVREDLRGSVKISYIAAENLYDGPCYVFKPTENVVAAEVYSSGYTKEILKEATPCPGTQWNGRKYFYAIPYKNSDSPTPHYPLQLRLQKGGDSPTGANYYSKVVKTDIPEVWTSWIRGQISINTATYNMPTP